MIRLFLVHNQACIHQHFPSIYTGSFCLVASTIPPSPVNYMFRGVGLEPTHLSTTISNALFAELILNNYWLGVQGSNLPSPDSKSVMLPTTLTPITTNSFSHNLLVPVEGLEPPLNEPDFESGVSTSSTIRAIGLMLPPPRRTNLLHTIVCVGP